MSLDILIIDDETLLRHDLASLLRSEGFTCETAASGEEGLALAESERPAIVLTDLVMPGLGGLEVVGRLSGVSPESAVIVVTAFGSLDSAIEAFRKGAVDYIVKPVVPADLFAKVHRLKERDAMARELRFLRRAVSEARTGTQIIGAGEAIHEVKRIISRVATAPSSVLIRGETGTGKELVARALHEEGPGVEAPFVPINCAALPHELIESELFGHVKGAFTGAIRDKPGVFELASGGTLFLDEIAELPLSLQPKLLRAIEEQQVMRVGGTRRISTPVRIVAATNRDLQDAVTGGEFREDLYFRIRVVEIVLPPLRERRDDIPELVDHLLQRLNERLGRRALGVEPRVMRLLMAWPWPGNVRELENVLERGLLLSDGETLDLPSLPAEMRRTDSLESPTDDLRGALRAYEAHHIGQVLAAAGGNREEAARRLGINPSTLYRRLKELDVRDDPAKG